MAARFFVNGGVTNNWSDILNWSTTSGGLGGSAVPTNADDVTLDAAGNVPCTLNTAVAKTCKTLTVTAGYTNTMTFNVTLTVVGNITLGANMVFAGSSGLILSTATTPTITSNGKTLGVPFTISGNTAITLADNWTLSSSFTCSGSTGTMNGNTMNVAGSFTATTQINGTTNIVLNGTGTLTTTGVIKNNLTINTAGTITAPAILRYDTGTLTYTAGTFSLTGTALTMGASGTIDLGGATLSGLNLTAAGVTMTLKSGIVLSGSITTSGTAASHDAIVSSLGGTQRVLTLSNGATQDIPYCNATDIDSSAGLTIFSYKGTLSNATNWSLLTAPLTVTRINIY